MEKFGSEPYQSLLHSVKVAKLVESSNGISRDKIKEILKPNHEDLDKYSLSLLENLKWIKEEQDNFVWNKIDNNNSKRLWESDEINNPDVSGINLQFATWALLASMHTSNIVPLPQIISVLINKNAWIIENKRSDTFFVDFKNRLTSESAVNIDLVQTTPVKLRAVFDNLNNLGLTRRLRRSGTTFYVHVEFSSSIFYFLLSNLIFSNTSKPKISNILKILNDIFGIIPTQSEIPKVLANCIYELKLKERIIMELISGEQQSFDIKNPIDRLEKDKVSHLRSFDG